MSLSNDSAAIAETYEYQAYGKPVIKDHTGVALTASPVGNFYLFTAREYDHETGLFYYRARYYSAETGRFLQEDKFFYPNGGSRYEYVSGQPINNTDSNGLLVDTLLDVYFIYDDLKDIYTRIKCDSGGLSLAFAALAGDLFGAAVPGLTGVGKGIKTTNELVDMIMKWLGPGSKLIKNRAGDLVLMSKDNLRKIRFDLNRPWPHRNPHFHVEEFVNGKWRGRPRWPIDVIKF